MNAGWRSGRRCESLPLFVVASLFHRALAEAPDLVDEHESMDDRFRIEIEGRDQAPQ